MSGNLFRSRLRELRGDVSQEDFALKIGTKQTTLSNWERGFREPNFNGLALISTSCEVSADWLLGLSDDRGVRSGTANNPNTNYYVLGNTDMPSCLIEMGFITAKEDNRLLDTYHDAYARAIADGIASILLTEK